MTREREPLRKGETVVWCGKEYRVLKPGGGGTQAELESVHNSNIIVFVDPKKFILED